MSSFGSTSVDSILKLSKVVSLKSSDSPSHALKVFAENHITSAPVINDSGLFVGVIEIHDIVSWIVQYVYKKYSVQHEDQKERIEAVSKLQIKAHDLDGFVHKFEHFPIEEIIRLHGSQTTTCVISPDTTLSSALTLFTSTSDLHISRLVVVDQNQKIVNYISKSALLKYFKSHSTSYSGIADKSLSSLEGSFVNVIAVCPHPSATTILTAFSLLHEYRLNTLALLDEQDKNHNPLTVLSLSDVKALHSQPRRISETVADYVRSARLEGSVQTSSPFISITPETTFSTAVEKLCSVHLHQIYVTNHKDGSVIGVCTLDTLLSVLKSNVSS